MGRSCAIGILLVVGACFAQAGPSDDSKEPPQMLLTDEGFIAIDTPRGWVRSEGPGLAAFLRKGDHDSRSAEVLIYINTSCVGTKQTVDEFIQDDIAGFRATFVKGTIRKEAPLDLANVKGQMLVWTFQSGEKSSAFERIAYAQESDRVLILVLSAKSKGLFDKSLPVFEEFAKSYRGSIWPAPDGKQQPCQSSGAKPDGPSQ
jgi:hypothetical protein